MDTVKISADGRYMYRRTHVVGPSTQVACVILDQTIHAEDKELVERCTRLLAVHGIGIIRFVGLFAGRYVTMQGIHVGPDNDKEIAQAASGAALVVCAWGGSKDLEQRAARVIWVPLRDAKLWCFTGESGDRPPLKLYRGGACREP